MLPNPCHMQNTKLDRCRHGEVVRHILKNLEKKNDAKQNNILQ